MAVCLCANFASNSGGGGERVLWTAVKAIQGTFPHVISVIYSGDTDVTQTQLLENVLRRFNIALNPKTIHIVPLRRRYWVSASRYPYFTMLGQSLGSYVLAYEAISSFVPDIFIDTMGYAFTLPFVQSVLEIPTAAYVHYPTISTDMLSRLPGVSLAKNIYRRLFAYVYGYVCKQMDVLMTNSSWTQAHMEQLTGKKASKGEIQTIFPPCDTTSLATLSLTPRERSIIYVAQFRPEKDHATVLTAFSILLSNNPHLRTPDGVKLILIGSVRDDCDRRKVEELKGIAKELDVAEQVEFICDAPWDKVVSWLGRGWIGTNAMWNEHFGIAVVEIMAAGLIPIVHDSGGPKLDIVTEFEGKPTGTIFSFSSHGRFPRCNASRICIWV
jgi:alpha-1,2-mannosyltransferase